MNTWADTLERFSGAIRAGAGFAPGEIVCPRYATERGLEVYRNNYRGNLHDTLAGAYPVIRQLVGDDFFRFLAKRFIEGHASRSGNLHRYGSEMAEFLGRFDHTQHLAYLPDMARLEWAYHRAYFADDVPPLDLTRLSRIAPGSYADLRWRLHPGCALLTSDFPIAAIWQAHQDGATAGLGIDLDSGGEHLLVYRNEPGVEIAGITPGNHYWLEQLKQGKTMGTATDATLSSYPDLDLANSLRYWLAQDVLVDFDIATEEAR